MYRSLVLCSLTLSLGLLASFSRADNKADTKAKPKITWKKTVIETRFRSEGVAIGDVNKDGKMDILTGEVWFEAPTWKMHEIRKVGDYENGDRTYSDSFACWTDDFNKDGWVDLLVVGFPGRPCYWYENPKGASGHWKAHEVWHSACNETPIYVDLHGKGQRVLVMGFQPMGKEREGQLAWFAPGEDPTKKWQMHPISEPSPTPIHKLTAASGKALEKAGVPAEIVTKLAPLNDKVFPDQAGFLTEVGKLLGEKDLSAQRGKLLQHGTIYDKPAVPGTARFDHGLGVGDVNGDGKIDVLCTAGWWEHPAQESGKSWAFHPSKLGPACADMFTYDMDGDGIADVLTSSAHNYGIWWHQQKKGSAGSEFLQKELFPKLVSQTHAMHFVDINGDGMKDLVTGKRWWAHGSKGDVDPNAPAKIFWFEAKKAADGIVSFTPHEIDNDSGIGTQFVVADFNGDKLLDVVVSNKKGTFLIEQKRE